MKMGLGLNPADRGKIRTALGGAPGAATTASLVSASYRLRQAFTIATSASNNFFDYRILDQTQLAVSGMYPVFGSEGVSSASGRTEFDVTYTPEYAYAVLSGSLGSGKDQSTATRTDCTFNGATSDLTFTGPDGTAWPFIWRTTGSGASLAKSPSNYADFTAAGGVISVQGGYPCVKFPSGGGWLVIGDKMNVILAANDSYIHQTRVMVPVQGSSTQTHPGVSVNLGNGVDCYKAAASYAAGGFGSLNWTSLTGALSGSLGQLGGPLAMIGVSLSGGKTYMIGGDSIAAGNPGDTNATTGTPGMFRRAFKAANKSVFNTACPASSVVGQNAQGQPFREWLLRFCSAEFNNHIHNGGTIADIKTMTLRSKSLMRPNSKVFINTATPTMTGGTSQSATAITGIISSGTTATATVASSSALSVGQPVVIGSADVAGYNGRVLITGKPSGTTFTYTLLGGASNLAAATTAKMGVGSATYATDYMSKTFYDYAKNLYDNPGSGNAAGGDPDGALDTYGAVNGLYYVWENLTDTQEGTHPLGDNTSGPNSDMPQRAAVVLASQIAAKMPF